MSGCVEICRSFCSKFQAISSPSRAEQTTYPALQLPGAVSAIGLKYLLVTTTELFHNVEKLDAQRMAEMKNIVTFIIPVRHQHNAKNWMIIKDHLTDTIKSISNQDTTGWKAIIVANHGADLPEIPNNFEVVRVDFPPNPIFEKGSAPIEKVYEAVRSDKGRRVLAGMLHAGKMGHVKVVDDDDFVSRKITSFVSMHRESNGFYIQDGYVWEDGGNWLFHYDGNFSKLCGTSHIVRADLYNLPSSISDASESYIQNMLGSHIFIDNYLNNNNSPLSRLPFLGAIYRIGHTENHSRLSGMFYEFFFQKWLWRRPMRQLKRLTRLKRLDNRLLDEYFGGSNI